ncbi:MAG: response regulator transcription factor [Rhizomicrobium sp.]|jgi:two-component system cell cycle response regulator CtrA
MNILVIEDDAAVRDSIELMLKVHGWEVSGTAFGEEGLDLARQNAFDLVLLDLNLPDVSGIEVLKRLRQANIATPVLVMSGDATTDVKVVTLRAGADDCISKPFHRDELVARIKAVARRGQVQLRTTIRMGDMVVDLDSKTVEAAGVRVALTIKEYEILELLLLRRGATLSKSALIEHLYSGMDEPEQKIIDVFVCKLRKKLSAATHGMNYIKTVWGLGYCWSGPEEAIAA